MIGDSDIRRKKIQTLKNIAHGNASVESIKYLPTPGSMREYTFIRVSPIIRKECGIDEGNQKSFTDVHPFELFEYSKTKSLYTYHEICSLRNNLNKLILLQHASDQKNNHPIGVYKIMTFCSYDLITDIVETIPQQEKSALLSFLNRETTKQGFKSLLNNEIYSSAFTDYQRHNYAMFTVEELRWMTSVVSRFGGMESDWPESEVEQLNNIINDFPNRQLYGKAN